MINSFAKLFKGYNTVLKLTIYMLITIVKGISMLISCINYIYNWGEVLPPLHSWGSATNYSQFMPLISPHFLCSNHRCPKFGFWLIDEKRGVVYLPKKLQEVTNDRWYTKPGPLFLAKRTLLVRTTENR